MSVESFMPASDALPFTAGIELTFLPSNVKSREELTAWEEGDESTDWCSKQEETARKLSKKLKGLYHDCGTDPCVVEISTRVLRSYGEAEWVCKKIIKAAKRVGLTNKVVDVCNGGGGHVHVGITDPVLRNAIYRDMANRPYLSWFFASPTDTVNCKAVMGVYTRHKPYSSYSRDNAGYWLSRPWEEVKNEFYHSEKYYAVRLHDETVEFRFFESYKDWAGYKEAVDFALAYCSWIQKRVNSGESFVVKFKRLQTAINHFDDFDLCVSEFRELVKELGLKWSVYKKYVKKLEKRFENYDYLV